MPDQLKPASIIVETTVPASCPMDAATILPSVVQDIQSIPGRLGKSFARESEGQTTRQRWLVTIVEIP